jgi:predicted nucleic acid-binding protein
MSFSSEAFMLSDEIFLDTEILLDYIVPSRRDLYKCSCLLLEEIAKGNLKAWSADYVLSEILGNLKGEREEKNRTSHILSETLTELEKATIQKIVSNVKNIPNFKIFQPTKPITQQQIYEIVKRLCIQTKDAIVVLTALDARNTLKGIELVTRDNKLLVRSKKEITTAHPSKFIKSCPRDCLSYFSCKYRK